MAMSDVGVGGRDAACVSCWRMTRWQAALAADRSQRDARQAMCRWGPDAHGSEWLVAIWRDGEEGDIRSASGSLSRRGSQSRVHRAGLGVGTVHKLGSRDSKTSLDRRHAILEQSLNTTLNPGYSWTYSGLLRQSNSVAGYLYAVARDGVNECRCLRLG
jgi:hypothetical protein